VSHTKSITLRKYAVSADTVRKVIKRVGNSRKKVYAALEKM
jgi:Mor family transcriptional regulator